VVGVREGDTDGALVEGEAEGRLVKGDFVGVKEGMCEGEVCVGVALG
jgi:hypothetical protein